MARPRKRPDSGSPGQPGERGVDDRSWSARTSVRPGEATADLVGYTALPAETGPTWAPDELSVWPVEGGRFGLDARYSGETGRQRARKQASRLAAAGLVAAVRDRDDGSALRLGPLTHAAVWLALEAFLGRPIDPVATEPAPGPPVDSS
jgi:hypothetical protein